MSNTRKAVGAAKVATGKWATLKREAEERAAARPARPVIKPYVIDDVEPPIEIAPPDDKRILIISECVGVDGSFNMARVMPLLRALCGDQFGRVWSLIPDDSDAASDMMLLLTQELVNHFQTALRDAMGAAELPGGTEDSSN